MRHLLLVILSCFTLMVGLDGWTDVFGSDQAGACPRLAKVDQHLGVVAEVLEVEESEHDAYLSLSHLCSGEQATSACDRHHDSWTRAQQWPESTLAPPIYLRHCSLLM